MLFREYTLLAVSGWIPWTVGRCPGFRRNRTQPVHSPDCVWGRGAETRLSSSTSLRVKGDPGLKKAEFCLGHVYLSHGTGRWPWPEPAREVAWSLDLGSRCGRHQYRDNS